MPAAAAGQEATKASFDESRSQEMLRSDESAPVVRGRNSDWKLARRTEGARDGSRHFLEHEERIDA